MIKNIPLPRFIGNDDKLNLPSKQENDILSREQLLAEQHTDPDIQLSKIDLPSEEVHCNQSRRLFLSEGQHPYAKMATT